MSFHPFTWWLWSLSLALALFISQDPWFAFGLTSVSAILVYSLREAHPWSRAFTVALRFIAVIVAIRLVIAIMVGVPIPGSVLFSLPQVSLPEWISGIRIGGPVTSERILSTLGEVLIIVGVVALFATAASLTSPHRAIRALPYAFYQLGLILTVATSVFPQLVASLARIKMARKLRGRPTGGIRHWRAIALPLLEESLERSLDLAAAMESRGFGQRVKRSRYRPDKWRRQDFLVLIAGVCPLIAVIIFSRSEISLHSISFLAMASLALAPLIPRLSIPSTSRSFSRSPELEKSSQR
jgi:energy-coupling factor transport system permease protein